MCSAAHIVHYVQPQTVERRSWRRLRCGGERRAPLPVARLHPHIDIYTRSTRRTAARENGTPGHIPDFSSTLYLYNSATLYYLFFLTYKHYLFLFIKKKKDEKYTKWRTKKLLTLWASCMQQQMYAREEDYTCGFGREGGKKKHSPSPLRAFATAKRVCVGRWHRRAAVDLPSSNVLMNKRPPDSNFFFFLPHHSSRRLCVCKTLSSFRLV